jgi:chromate transport protein ChrA
MTDTPIPQPEREPIAKHRHERNLQILLPVLVVVALVLLTAALVVIEALAQNPQLSQWAATAGIILLGITMGLMVLLFIVIGALVVLLYMALQKTPTYTGRFSEQFLHYSALSRQYMDKATEPLIAVKTWLGVAADFTRRKK